VICGPVIYGKNPKAWLGEEGEFKVAIPDAFYKIIVRTGDKPNHPAVLAFIYPQDAPREKPYSTASHLKYAVPVDSIEKVTELDFLTKLPDTDEKVIEAKKAGEVWE